MPFVLEGIPRGAPYLYRYQPFNIDRLRPVIVDKRLYFSRPGSFNDPWDCKPCFDIDLSDDASVLAHAEYFERVDRKHNSHLSEEEHAARARLLREDRDFLEARVQDMYGIHAEIDRRYRVCCLASLPVVPLMWSHYAAAHAGVCLQFSVDDFFGRALRVQYSDYYPSMSLVADGPAALEALLTKSSDWSYEEEYRLIAQERSEAVPVETLMTDNNWISFPASSLRAVYLGCRMPAEHRKAIRELVRLSPTPVELRQMHQVPNRYALRDEKLPP